MADITFVYLGKCSSADPHVELSVRVGGVEKLRVADLLSELVTVGPERSDYEATARVLLFSFARKWRRDNPAGTLVQFKDALEAEMWVI